MTDDRIEGTARKGFGHIQDAVGGLTGDAKTQAKGKLNETVGGVQNAFGKAKDTAADGYNRARGQVEDTYGQIDRVLRDQPLLGIGVGLALGALIGLLLGEARRDRR
jgi:uncharacterized protein YjbJ (UPF0337 family)